MKIVTFTITIFVVFGLAHSQPAPFAMTTTGAINTIPFVQQGNPIELLGSAANAFLNIPAANLANTYLFTGDTVANTTKIFASMMNSLNNFFFTYTNSTEPYMAGLINGTLINRNSILAMTSQNFSANITASRANYSSYLNSTNRSSLNNITSSLINFTNIFNSVNNLWWVSPAGNNQANQFINNVNADLAFRTDWLQNQNNTQNILIGMIPADYQNLNQTALNNVSIFCNNIQAQAFNANSSIAANIQVENSTFNNTFPLFNGSWVRGWSLWISPNICPVDGFNISGQANTAINNVFNVMEYATKNFTDQARVKMASINSTYTNIDNQVQTFVNAVTELQNYNVIFAPNSSNPVNMANLTASNNQIMRMIANAVYGMLRNNTAINATFVGPSYNQFLNRINSNLNAIVTAVNQINQNFASSSAEKFWGDMLVQQIQALGISTSAFVASINANFGPMNPTVANSVGIPMWFNQNNILSMPNDFSTLNNYMNDQWVPVLNNLNNLMNQFRSINNFINSQSDLFVQSFMSNIQFTNAFNPLLSIVVNATINVTNTSRQVIANLTNYAQLNANFWQNQEQQVIGFNNQVNGLKNQFTSYVSNVVGRQRLIENAIVKSAADANLVSDLQSVHTNYLKTMLAAVPTTPLGLQISSTTLNATSNSIPVNQVNFVQIDACLVSALGVPCNTKNFYYDYSYANLNLTANPGVLLSTFVSQNATFAPGMNGVITGLPASNPLLFNSNPPASGPASTYYVGQGDQMVSYSVNLIYLSSSYLVVQVQAPSNQILNQFLVLNVTLQY